MIKISSKMSDITLNFLNLNLNSFEEYINETVEIDFDDFKNLATYSKGNIYQAFVHEILVHNHILCYVHATILFLSNNKRKTLSDGNIDLNGE